MADKMTRTTSSISLEKELANVTKTTSSHMPTKGEAQIVTRLAENITESYRMATQKQQKLNDLTNQQHYHQQHLKRIHNESSSSAKLLKPTLKTPTEEWQELCSPKNKLKRKKTLSASLTSVTDSVNQEKRTRIEGMQLNCRGRLPIKDNINTTNPPASPASIRSDNLISKPPLPPSSKNSNPESRVALNPPPRLKRQLQENVQTIQKLNALTEQLRLEINELKSSLTNEKGAVRVLRAQNESEARKWKNEVKKLQHAVELLKKAGVNKKCDATNTNNENLPQAAMGNLVNYEIQRLTNEINMLKEANKALEEKKSINCDADRRKAADIRELKDSYEIRLTQIQKSAKNEISRLLEEIKTKERNIGQLKKDLQILQNSKNFSRNATTNQTTNKATKLQSTKKPKSSSSNDANKQNKEYSKELENTTKLKDLTKAAENSNEISKLKNIELINNTKNVTTNLQKSTKILNTHNSYSNNNEKETENLEHNNENTITILHTNLKALELPELHANNAFKGCKSCCKSQSHKRPAPLLLTAATQTIEISRPTNSTNPLMPLTATAATQTSNVLTCSGIDQFDEQHITQELTQHLENKAMQEAKENHPRHSQHHPHHHHHNPHNNHSDSDSALSSAPTSISPQPPANGEEPTDLWQTMRSYTHDIEKLQKEVDLLQKQNEQLKEELNVAKEQIVELEITASENARSPKMTQLLEHIKHLEDQERHLQAEASELREQNELLEFRILELEETNDKWSLHNHTNPTCESAETVSSTAVANTTQNLWRPAGLSSNNKRDPFEMLFGNSSQNSIQPDSGIISPQNQHHQYDLMDVTNDELCQRLGALLKKSSLEEDERLCLQQVLNLVQQLDALTPRSGPNSLSATSFSDDASSLDLVKPRPSDYSTPLFTPGLSARLAYETTSGNATKTCAQNLSNLSSSRIIATVQPYNSTAELASHNTPTDSPRKLRCQPWQTNSLSESGVFVESDFYSDISDNNVCTQTDFEDSGIAVYSTHHIFTSPTKKLPVQEKSSPNSIEEKRLQYYKERAKVLENKVLIYESSGDVQAKRLAERLQREIQLEKEVGELRDRVKFLESERNKLEEEKCEFEEAENDTRLRLQRLEIELEILRQRNVELEMSREALSAKYKDCHSECLILRDDLATCETQIRHLEEDKQKAKENLEFLHNTLPLLLICNTFCTLAQVQNKSYPFADFIRVDMGNESSDLNLTKSSIREQAGGPEQTPCAQQGPCSSQEIELKFLREEIKRLKLQLNEQNTTHYAAMETADCHWVDLEKEYKDREEKFIANEACFKLKIQKLQSCLREESRSANEKICQLEEQEENLKSCLVKINKDYQNLKEGHECLIAEFDCLKEQFEEEKRQQQPLIESLESEKKCCKSLTDELAFMNKLQEETEKLSKQELECVRGKMSDLRKELLHSEVTNGELKEEVATLELQVQCLEKNQEEYEEKIRCLTDEIRTKDEICQKLEKRLERAEGYSLADELINFNRDDVKDLKTASKGLAQALRRMDECESLLPLEKQFQFVGRDVKKLADKLLDENPEQENEIVPENETNMNDDNPESPIDSNDKSQDETEQETLDIQPVEEEGVETNITVGMTLVPQINIDENLLPSCSQKKAICEVPSELRKLAEPTNKTEVFLDCRRSQEKSLKIKRGKRYPKRRITRGRVSILHFRVNRMVSRIIFDSKPQICRNVSYIDVNKSEVLQRNVSYGSFRSLQEETNVNMEPTTSVCTKIDASVECEIEIDKEEIATARLVKKSTSNFQVNNQTAPELEIEPITETIHRFLEFLRSSNPDTKIFLNSSLYNAKITQQWNSEPQFRQGLKILVNFLQWSTDISNCARLESYEDFVSVMNCLDILENIFKPYKNAMLAQIETDINERLMDFHNEKKESEFYCTVYYPVKRKSGLNLTKLLN